MKGINVIWEALRERRQNVVLEVSFFMNKFNSEKTISPDRIVTLRFVNELESVTSVIDCNFNNELHIGLKNTIIF